MRRLRHTVLAPLTCALVSLLAGCGGADDLHRSAELHGPPGPEGGDSVTLADASRDVDAMSAAAGNAEDADQGDARDGGADASPTVDVGETRVVDCSGVLSFDDVFLEKSIRKAVHAGDAPITARDVATLIDLEVESNGVKSLQGIQCLTALKTLNIGGLMEDLSPVAHLTGLEHLGVSSYNLAVLPSLADLQHLKTLALAGTMILDFSALKDLTSLQRLLLDGSLDFPVTDISWIAALHQLTELEIRQAHLSDISGLKSLPLRTLRLSHDAVEDLAPLAGSPLQELFLDGNPLADLAPLASATGLVHLDLQGTRVSDVAPLAGLRNLQFLQLASTGVVNLSPLAPLNALVFLGLDDTPVSDIAPLRSLQNLAYFHFSRTRIADLSPLSSMMGLQTIDATSSSVTSLAPIANLPKLEAVSLIQNMIGDLAPLANLPKLRVLDLGFNQVTDLSPLVANHALGTDGYVGVTDNPINCQAQNANIRALEARGVELFSGCP